MGWGELAGLLSEAGGAMGGSDGEEGGMPFAGDTGQ